MQNRGLIIVGSVLILMGLTSFISSVFHIDMGAICFPLALILIGVFMLFGPRLKFMGENARFQPLGDLRERGAWQVENLEYWTFVGGASLDMREAEIPPGETTIRLYGFVGDAKLYLPAEVGYRIESTGFLTSSKIEGVKSDIFVSTLRRQSDNYAEAERTIRLETFYFVLDLKVQKG